MNQNPDDAWLIALGAMVSDGGAVDWDDAERRPADPEQQRLVRQLRQLATIVKAHRSTTLSPRDAREPAPAPPGDAAQWRHLVLFERVGAGAFGSVYRGWDPLLDREVAVKLLSRGHTHAAATTPLNEARHLARIRHSNIVVVHGADEDAEKAGIWMEYIDGQTLADIVRQRGPMSAREVTGIGLDLCSALSAIHAAGLLHRDIKAHNVMREVGGRIVLMDFSGAHAIKAPRADGSFSGTPLYMAPELFEGAPPSAATDVYSLGVLLFFLLSGGLPVDGQTMDDVRAAHVKGARKRLRDLRPDVPDALVQVIERATARDAAARFHTAGELEHALAAASGARAFVTPPATASPRETKRVWPLLATAAITLALVLSTVAAVGRWGSDPEPRGLAARFTIGPPYISGSWPRISPDGRFVVFGAIVEGRNRFWVRPLDSLGGRPLMPTTAQETPFWSPDSAALGYFADGRLYRIAVDGGEPQVLADAPGAHGGAWTGNTILYAREDGIYRLNASGGPAERVTAVDLAQDDYQHGWPEFLPDGRRFLYIVRSARPERSGVFVGSLDGEAPRRLMPAYSRVSYADGRLLYVREGTLVAHPFDARALALRGEPVTIAGRVKYHAASDAAFDVSDSGVLIYSVTPGQAATRLVLYDRRGRELGPLTDVGTFGHPTFSPDGARVAAEKVDAAGHNADVWVFATASRSATRLTNHPGPDVRPVWSPDGARIAFSSKRGSVFDVYVKSVDAVDEERPLLSAPGDKMVEHWSADGRYLTGTVLRSGLWLVPATGTEKPRLLRAGERAETWQSELSPDGRWLAYMSSESGHPEVYVEPFPQTGSRWQVSVRGGAEPHWRGDGRELLYLDPDGVVTAVGVGERAWKASTPRALFRVAVPDLAGGNDYAVSPDGRFLVVNTFVSDPIVPPIDVVTNWTTLFGR